MANDREHIFDEAVRAVLDGAEEMPPDRVWAGIESSLGAKKTPAGRVRLFRVAGSVSVAAAVAALVLLVRPSADEPQSVGQIAENASAQDAEIAGGLPGPLSGTAAGSQSDELIDVVQDAPEKIFYAFAAENAAGTPAENLTKDAGVAVIGNTAAGRADNAVASDTETSRTTTAAVRADNAVASDTETSRMTTAADNSATSAASNTGTSQEIFVVANSGDTIASDTETSPMTTAADNSATSAASNTGTSPAISVVANSGDTIASDTETFPAALYSQPATQSGKPGSIELTVGGNSFIGSGKESHDVRMMSAGNLRRPTVTSIRENNNPDTYFLPLSFGAGVKFKILKWLDLGIGVNYTLLSKRITGSYFEVDGTGMLFRSFETQFKNSQHYIGIPIDIYFNIYGNEHWNSYASIGTCVEKGISNHYSGLYEGQTITLNEKISGVQTSVKVGLGIEYYPVRFLGIYIDPGLRYYFDNAQPRSIRTVQPFTFGVEAGLRFRL